MQVNYDISTEWIEKIFDLSKKIKEEKEEEQIKVFRKELVDGYKKLDEEHERIKIDRDYNIISEGAYCTYLTIFLELINSSDTHQTASVYLWKILKQLNLKDLM